MRFEDRPLLRFLLAGLIALALVVAGVTIGATLWPRMVTVEQHVLAPAVRAVARDRGVAAVPDLVDANCPAVVAIEPQGGAAAVAAPPPAAHASHSGRSGKAVRAAKARAAKAAMKPVDLPPARLAGFLVSGNGDVLTSTAYLPAEGALTVLLNDGRRLAATRTGADPVSGLALLKIEGSDFPFLQFAADNFPRTGEAALTLFTPNGSGCVAQFGLVSADFVAEQGADQSYVRIAPALEAGLAGAPVLDMDGRVMGIAGLGLPATDAATDASRLLPAGTAASVLSDLLRNGGPTPNPLGLYASDLTPALAQRLGATRQRGAVVTMVAPQSPAERAGVRAGDIIVSVGDAPVAGASELGRALDAGDDSVSLAVLRRAESLTFSIDKPAQ